MPLSVHGTLRVERQDDHTLLGAVDVRPNKIVAIQYPDPTRVPLGPGGTRVVASLPDALAWIEGNPALPVLSLDGCSVFDGTIGCPLWSWEGVDLLGIHRASRALGELIPAKHDAGRLVAAMVVHPHVCGAPKGMVLSTKPKIQGAFTWQDNGTLGFYGFWKRTGAHEKSSWFLGSTTGKPVSLWKSWRSVLRFFSNPAFAHGPTQHGSAHQQLRWKQQSDQAPDAIDNFAHTKRPTLSEPSYAPSA